MIRREYREAKSWGANKKGRKKNWRRRLNARFLFSRHYNREKWLITQTHYELVFSLYLSHLVHFLCCLNIARSLYRIDFIIVIIITGVGFVATIFTAAVYVQKKKKQPVRAFAMTSNIL